MVICGYKPFHLVSLRRVTLHWSAHPLPSPRSLSQEPPPPSTRLPPEPSNPGPVRDSGPRRRFPSLRRPPSARNPLFEPAAPGSGTGVTTHGEVTPPKVWLPERLFRYPSPNGPAGVSTQMLALVLCVSTRQALVSPPRLWCDPHARQHVFAFRFAGLNERTCFLFQFLHRSDFMNKRAWMCCRFGNENEGFALK